MISHVDSNGTGEIEIHEFLTLMQDLAHADDVLKIVEAVAQALTFNLGDAVAK